MVKIKSYNGHHVTCLHIINVYLNLGFPILMSSLTYFKGSLLLPLVDESCIPVYGSILLMLLNFSKQILLIMDLEAPQSKSVESFFLVITVWKSAVHLPSI